MAALKKNLSEAFNPGYCPYVLVYVKKENPLVIVKQKTLFAAIYFKKAAILATIHT